MSAENRQQKIKACQSMPSDMQKKAKKLFSIPSGANNENLISLYIINEIERLNLSYIIDSAGNIIIKKGKGLKPCFVSHLDTVHTYKKGFNIIHTKKGANDVIYAYDDNKQQVGVGADDKAGIFACLELLESLTNVMIVFFSGEESGCIGSNDIDLDVFSDCMFIASIDRWGSSDIINSFYNQKTISKKFTNYLQIYMRKYGYQFTSGLLTDSLQLFERNVNLSCINVSCGYYQHHSNLEYIDLNELYECILLCYDIAVNCNKQYPKSYTVECNKWDAVGYTNNHTDNNFCLHCNTLLLTKDEKKNEVCVFCNYTTDICDYCGEHLITKWEKENVCCWQCYKEICETTEDLYPESEKTLIPF